MITIYFVGLHGEVRNRHNMPVRISAYSSGRSPPPIQLLLGFSRNVVFFLDRDVRDQNAKYCRMQGSTIIDRQR